MGMPRLWLDQATVNAVKLIETPESIVPEQSVIDSWPTMKREHSQNMDKRSAQQEPVLENADEAKFYATYLEASRYAP